MVLPDNTNLQKINGDNIVNNCDDCVNIRLWALAGNDGTDSSVDFLGTTDAEPLTIRTNNNIAVKIDATSTSSTLFTFFSDDVVSFQNSLGNDIISQSISAIQTDINDPTNVTKIRLDADMVQVRPGNDLFDIYGNYPSLAFHAIATDNSIRILMDTSSTGYNLILPVADSNGPQALTSDGNGNLSWSNFVKKINVNTTSVGNVGAGEDNLMTYTLPSSTLSVNGDSINFRASGTIANTANAKRIRVKFGATTILDTGAGVIPISRAYNWTAEGEVIRTGATTQKCNVTINVDYSTIFTFVGYSTAAETLSGTVVFKLTGEAVSNNDIVQETLQIYLSKNT